jgi:plasmid stability protein
VIAEPQQVQQNACMSSITIRDVPDETRAELASRAARSGRSMQEYLRLKLVELAAVPERKDVLDRVARRKARTATRVPRQDIIAARDAERR